MAAVAGGEGVRAPLARVVLLTLALGVAVVPALLLLQPATGARLLEVPWWVLLVVFALVEAGDVRISLRGQVESVSLSEIPLVVGLFGTDAAWLLLARALGSLVVFVLVRRQPLVKVAFNLALVSAGTSVALVAFVSVLGDHPPDSGRGWVAALLAVAAAGLLDTAALALVQHWFTGAVPVERAGDLAWASLQPVLVGAMGVVVVLALGTGEALVPVVAVCVAIWAAYRAYARLRSRHSALANLYGLSEALAQASHADEGVVGALLGRTAHVLRCDHAELVLAEHASTDEEGPSARRWSLDAPSAGPAGAPPVQDAVAAEGAGAPFGRPLEGAQVVRGASAEERAALARTGVREALVVPLHIDADLSGHLLVGYRPGPRPRFTSADQQLLEMVANHGTVALRTSRLFSRLSADAHTDELTGLPNRKAFRRLLDAAASSAASDGPACAVMVLDFDGFKAVNDTLGHHAGDELLQAIGGRLVAAAGPDGVVARLGGDEFACVSTMCGERAQAERLASRLLTVFDTAVLVGTSRVRVGGSLGIALGPLHGVTGSDLLRGADMAMYAAKHGAGGHRLFSPELDDGSAASITLAGDLRDALVRGDITVQALPLVSLATGRVHSLEVLARWTHPELGPVQPETFFDAAQRSGQTAALSGRVLDEALALGRRLSEVGTPVRVAVNVAARWLMDETLPEQIGRALAYHGVPPQLLALELSESSVIADPTGAIATLQRLRGLGVHLAVDDFGTGLSSLTYLARLPVDQLKIDRSFVQRLGEGERDRVIAQTILDLGRGLGIETVAEGVSDERTVDVLRGMGCALAQGYLFTAPLDGADLPAFLAERGIEQQDVAPASSPVPVAPSPPVPPLPPVPPSPRPSAEPGGLLDRRRPPR